METDRYKITIGNFVVQNFLENAMRWLENSRIEGDIRANRITIDQVVHGYVSRVACRFNAHVIEQALCTKAERGGLGS
jgi:hypothetical protein